jgi:hypothetical protein
LDLGGVLVQNLLIDHVEARPDGRRIVTRGDPGLHINGDLIKLQHFPCWGIRGACRFAVDMPVLWEPSEVKSSSR